MDFCVYDKIGKSFLVKDKSNSFFFGANQLFDFEVFPCKRKITKDSK